MLIQNTCFLGNASPGSGGGGATPSVVGAGAASWLFLLLRCTVVFQLSKMSCFKFT
jgi:hypothetical protein